MIPEYDRCGRCGRRLKNPESRRLGFGAVCYSKVQTRQERVPLFSMEAKIDEDDKGGKEKANIRTLDDYVKEFDELLRTLDDYVKEFLVDLDLGLLTRRYRSDEHPKG